jgi:hypothetical protein
MTREEAADILESLGYQPTNENVNRVLEHSHTIEAVNDNGSGTETDILNQFD